MSHAVWHTGDTREVLATLPDASVDLVLTSPPFLALRSYLPADHPDKALEIGSEPNPGEFLDVLLDVTEELARVLAPHGSLCVELGDTYAGGGQGPDANHPGSDRPVAATRGTGWPLAKSLCMIPSTYAWALAYGRNPWTGRTTDPWRVRNLIAWCRPNPPVGALGDKFRPGTSYMTVACKSGQRYFDLDAVREPGNSFNRPEGGENGSKKRGPDIATHDRGLGNAERVLKHNPAGAPPLDWWAIPTHPYPGSHYATFPPELCVRPIKAMCPQRVCRVCGKPSERIVEEVTPRSVDDSNAGKDRTQGQHVGGAFVKSHTVTPAVRESAGWSDCGHDDWRAGVVLDPFAGSGTTLAVATGHGRDAIGIDLDPRNFDLARERIGMFLEEA